jgi:hypothetical protein
VATGPKRKIHNPQPLKNLQPCSIAWSMCAFFAEPQTNLYSCQATFVPSPENSRYHLLPRVRGHLLAKLGRFDHARPQVERAATLTPNARELLLERARACLSPQAPLYNRRHPCVHKRVGYRGMDIGNPERGQPNENVGEKS